MEILSKVPFYHVDINMGFWQERQKLNREVTLKAVMDRFMETGRFDAFRCDWREGMPNKPHIFWDSDVAKWIEAVAYALERGPLPRELTDAVNETIDRIERQQDPNGYVNSYFTAIEPAARFSRRWAHELYCAGHLMEAAVAWNHATGDDRFLRIMCKYADYIDRVFRIDHSAGFATPGHQEIELALVKLYEATGEERYLKLSKHFIDLRGAQDKDPERNRWELYAMQSHMPARQQKTAEGHAVRAGYMYSGMADLARECRDEELKQTCQALFDNISRRRMYVTGGVGSTHRSESYTIDYNLPNETAYTETCAAIALAFFARRMLLLDPDARYADVIERILYNGFLSSTSLDGRKFYYSNPMEVLLSRHRAHPSSELGDWIPAPERVEVFTCSCCPPNIVRFVEALGEYLYTVSDSSLYLHQYMGSHMEHEGMKVDVVTDYPVSGVIRVKAEGLAGRDLRLRLPGWCQGYEASRPCRLEKGYLVFEDAEGQEILLSLNMTPHLVEANPNVSDDAGKVCVCRGPVLYCLEGVDNGERLMDCLIDQRADFAEEALCFSPFPGLSARGWQRTAPEGDWLYRAYAPSLAEKTLRFVPYYTQQNRGATDMRLWIPIHQASPGPVR